MTIRIRKNGQNITISSSASSSKKASTIVVKK